MLSGPSRLFRGCGNSDWRSTTNVHPPARLAKVFFDLIAYLIDSESLIPVHQRLTMLIHPLGLVRTFPYICTVLQQFVSYEQPRSAPVSGRELLTIGYLQALPWQGFVSLMDSLSQVSTSPHELVPC